MNGQNKEEYDIVFYANPLKVLPIWDRMAYGKKSLQRKGYDQLVGVAGGVLFSDRKETPQIKIEYHAPAKFPLSKITKYWQCFDAVDPDTAVPAFLVKGFHGITIDRLVLTSVNRNRVLEIKEETAKENQDLQSWEKEKEALSKIYGSFEIYKDHFSGLNVTGFYTAKKPEIHRYRVIVNQFKTESAARGFIQKQCMDSKQFPLKKMDLKGFEAWFQTDKVALEAASDRHEKAVQAEDLHLVENEGFILTDQWWIHGRKEKLERMVNRKGSYAEFSHFLNKRFPGYFDQHEIPAYVDCSFAWKRRWRTMLNRRQFFMMTRKRKEAFKQLVEIDYHKPLFKSIQITSIDDRVYCLYDLFVFKLLSTYSSDVFSYGYKQQSFHFNWGFYKHQPNGARQ